VIAIGGEFPGDDGSPVRCRVRFRASCRMKSQAAEDFSDLPRCRRPGVRYLHMR